MSGTASGSSLYPQPITTSLYSRALKQGKPNKADIPRTISSYGVSGKRDSVGPIGAMSHPYWAKTAAPDTARFLVRLYCLHRDFDFLLCCFLTRFLSIEISPSADAGNMTLRALLLLWIKDKRKRAVLRVAGILIASTWAAQFQYS